MWTAERIEALKKLHADGALSTRAMGKEIGVTKNAVISKLRRMGLSGREISTLERQRIGRRGGLATRAKEKEGQPTRGIVRSQAVPAPAAPKLSPQPLPPPRPIVAKKPFADLQDGDCRYPLGDSRNGTLRFCGEPKAPGKSWCPRCCQIVFVQREAKAA